MIILFPPYYFKPTFLSGCIDAVLWMGTYCKCVRFMLSRYHLRKRFSSLPIELGKCWKTLEINMGQDSSTLQSIESLNSTLEDIEKKLFIIEDVHLHHERTISHDEAVVISGKQIVCRSGVKLLCGPVLGLIGSSFARILVEVDQDAAISFNVFQTDAKLICTRFVFSVSFNVRKNAPSAYKITGLEAGTNYTVYIGGISPSETVKDYAMFQTMPKITAAIRILSLNNGRVDRQMPGETNLWKEVENRVIAPKSSPPGYFNPGYRGNIFTSPYLQYEGTNPPPSAPPPVHLLCHHGNLISIQSVLQTKAIELLDLLTREDSNYEDWSKVLTQLELTVKDAYRNAFTSPGLIKILRRCGNVFLAGSEEAGLLTSSLLALNLPDKLKPPMPTPAAAGMESDEAITDDNASASDAESTKGGGGGASFKSGSAKSGKAKLKRGRSKKMKRPDPVELVVDEQRKLQVPAQEGADLPEDIDLTPAIGSAMRRFYDAEQLSVKSRGIVLENLRRLLVGVIVRLLR